MRWQVLDTKNTENTIHVSGSLQWAIKAKFRTKNLK